MLRFLLRFAAVAAVLAIAWIGWSFAGRGTRPADGVETSALAESDHRVVYYTQGEGETVVLLASLARPASDFNELARALVRGGFRTLAVESRGIGGTDGGGPLATPTLHELGSDVLAVLRASGLPETERVHMIGHAFGNRVARTFAADHPERMLSLTLVAAGARQTIPADVQRAMLGSFWSFLPWSVREPALRLAFFAGDNEIPDYWRTGWSYWGALAQIHAARATPSTSFWDGGRAPMLVIQADDDMIAPPESSGIALRDEFPDRVTLVRVPDAGHALLPEQPALIEESALAFLRRHRVH